MMEEEADTDHNLAQVILEVDNDHNLAQVVQEVVQEDEALHKHFQEEALHKHFQDDHMEMELRTLGCL